jgi:CO/xanthine dehydrogenase Mo-binding subunit
VIGERRLRVEDRRLLSGRGRYLAEDDLAGPCHIATVRSPVAHATITGTHTSGDTTSGESSA